EPPGVPGLAHGRYGDDVPQRGDASGVGAALVEGATSGGGRVEQGAAVDVVGEVPGRTPGHPGQFGVVGEVGGDLRAGVAAPDDDHALAREVPRSAVGDGVQLPALEVAAAGDGGEEGTPPSAGRADHRACVPRAG